MGSACSFLVTASQIQVFGVTQRFYYVIVSGFSSSNYGSYTLYWGYNAPAASPAPGVPADGLSLVIHRDPSGSSALGTAGGGMGFYGIQNSFGARFDTFSDFSLGARSTYGYMSGGIVPSNEGALALDPGYNANPPFFLSRGGISVNFTYSAGRAYTSMWANANPSMVYTYSAAADLPSLLGCTAGVQGCDAYVGFVAATGGLSENHQVLSFGYVNNAASQTPTPSITPSKTPSSSLTASVTASSTMTSSPTATVSASVGPMSWDQLATDAITLSCPPGKRCSTALNFCRSSSAAAVNVKPQYTVFAMGRLHGCAIDALGDARCFGTNSFGQAPRLPIGGPFIHIAVLDDCSCALKRDGSAIVCWGATGRAGCPALVTGGFSNFALSASNYLLTITANRTAVCYGDVTQPGCVNVTGGNAVMAVATAGRASCVLLDRGGVSGDGSAGGDVSCFGVMGTTSRSGPYGNIAGVSNGTFCGLLGYLGMRGNRLECWGDSAGALLPSGPATGPYRHISSSYHDPVLYAVKTSTGFIESFDAEYDASRGCGGARCACSPGSALCDARNPASFLYPLAVAQAAMTTGLSSGYMARLTCYLTCGLAVSCFGPDAADPLLQPPPWIQKPCALAVPQDVGSISISSDVIPPVCTVSSLVSSSMAGALARDESQCNLRGMWNNQSLFIEQTGGNLKLYPQAARYGTIDYARFAAGEQGQLTPDGGGIQIKDSTRSSAVVKASGTLNQDCSRIYMSDGSRWDASKRCNVRYLRLKRGAIAHPELLPLAGSGHLPSPADDGQPGLFLSEVAVYDVDGAEIASTARLAASSTDSSACGSSNTCLRSAVDGNTSTAFVTAPAWGADGDTDSWLQLDFGADLYISRISLTAADSNSSAATPFGRDARSIFENAFLGVRAIGYSDANLMTLPPPSDESQLTPAFTYRVVASDDLSTAPSSFEFKNVHLQCGFDARASASASPTSSTSATASATGSSSRTATMTATLSPTSSLTPSSTMTSSMTSTSSATPSMTPTTSATGSTTGTQSGTATPTA